MELHLRTAERHVEELREFADIHDNGGELEIRQSCRWLENVCAHIGGQHDQCQEAVALLKKNVSTESIQGALRQWLSAAVSHQRQGPIFSADICF